MTKRAKASAPGGRRRKANTKTHSHTVAESSGLDKTADRRSEVITSDGLVDRQFQIWMALVKASPWSAAWRQQIRVARSLFDLLPATRPD